MTLPGSRILFLKGSLNAGPPIEPMPAPARHHVPYRIVGLQYHEVGVSTDLEPALPGEPQELRHVARERRQHLLQRTPAREQRTERDS